MNLANGITSSLDGKLSNALKLVDDMNAGNEGAAINSLEAFINTVEAQRGKKLTDSQANDLIAQANAIIDVTLGS